MYTRDIGAAELEDGLYLIQAEFVTEHLVIRGEVRSPDDSLYDHLNSSTTSVEIRPLSVQRLGSAGDIELSGAHAHITKAHILFSVPLTQPERHSRPDNVIGTWTRTKRCWAVFGRYALVGKIQADVGRDTRLILRSMEQKQFLPFTEVTVTGPGGQSYDYDAVIVNRSHLELLALGDL